MTGLKALLGASLCASLIVFSPAGDAAADYEDLFLDRDFEAARDDAIEEIREGELDGDDTSDLDDAISYYGWSEFMLDNFVQARAAFQRLYQADENMFDATLGQAWVAIKLGQFDIAEPFLDEAEGEAENWQEFMVLDARGWLAANQGDIDAARAFFEEEDDALAWGQDDEDDPMVGLAWLELNAGNLDAAEEYFEEGLDRKDDCFFCYDGFARIALARDDAPGALEHVLDGLSIARRNSGLSSLLQVVLFQIGDPAVSVSAYNRLIDEHPDDLEFVVGRGYAHLFGDNVDAAEADFQSVLDEEPGNVGALNGMASLDSRLAEFVADGWEAYFAGRFNDAMARFDAKRRAAYDILNPAAEVGRGWTFLALGQPQEALDTFRYAAQFDENYTYTVSGIVEAQRQLLTTYFSGWQAVTAQDYGRARQLFEQARAEADSDSAWLIDDGLAWVKFYEGDISGAEAAFSSVVSANPDAFLSRTGLGFTAIEEGDYEAAVDHLSSSFSRAPFQAIASYITPAQALLDANQDSRALEILQLAENAYPLSADVQFLMARAFVGLRDPQTAALRATAAAQLAPAYIDPAFDDLGLDAALTADAQLAMGWGLFYSGDFDGSLARFDRYQSAGGTDDSAALGRGWVSLAQGDAGRALSAFESIDPEGSVGGLARSGILAARQARLVNYNAGWAQLNAGDFDAAEASFNAARSEVSPELPWVADEGLAWTQYYRGDYGPAEAGFRNILVTYPDAFTARLGAGYSALQQGNFGDGLQMVRDSLSAAPFQGANAYATPAAILVDAGRLDDAVALLETGEPFYPVSADIQAVWARVLRAQGDTGGATERAVRAALLAPAYIDPVYDELAEAGSPSIDAYLAMGWGLYFAGLNERAIERFDAYLAAGGTDPNATRGRAFALFRLDRTEEALPGLTASLALEPDTLLLITELLPIPETDQFWTVAYNATTTMAWAQFRLGNYSDAEDWFRRALADYPNLLDARTGLGYALAEQGQRGAALAEFDEALRISPIYPDALRGRESLQ